MSVLVAAKECIKKYRFLKKLIKFLLNPWVSTMGVLYGTYLTIRYVDDYKNFPAINFKGGLIRLHIKKAKGAKLNIANKLTINPLGVSRMPSLLQMGENATINIENHFTIGDDVRISVEESGRISFKGKGEESGSGITARCIIKAQKEIIIGYDVIIAWDTFITDSDWHPVRGTEVQKDTMIGNHVWVSVGAKILKGSIIGDNSIVGCGAVVTGGVFTDRSLLGGVPARVIKSPISDWSREMVENDK